MLLASIKYNLIKKIKFVTSFIKTCIATVLKVTTKFSKLIIAGVKYGLSFFASKKKKSSPPSSTINRTKNDMALLPLSSIDQTVVPRFPNAATEQLLTLISRPTKITVDGSEIRDFVAQGADLFARDQMYGCFKNSILLWGIANAKIHNSIQLLNYLFVNYPDKALLEEINYQCSSGYTALHLAVCKGWDHVDRVDRNDYPMKTIIQKLIQLGANPNIQDNDGNTPLHIACMRQDWECIDYLIQAGANCLPNKEGKVPYSKYEAPQDMLAFSYSVVRDYLYKKSRAFTLRFFTPIKGFNNSCDAGSKSSRHNSMLP